MSGTGEIPPYRDLTPVHALRARHAWGVFGEHDELGRVNLLTPERVAAACREAVRGAVFNLSLPLHLP
jgi:hypothetical protein